MSITRAIEPFEITAGETSSPWRQLNSKFGDNNPRSFTGNLVSGDTINIQLSNDKDPNTLLETFTQSEDYTTATFGGTYIGGFLWVRVVKAGSAGAAKVQMEL